MKLLYLTGNERDTFYSRHVLFLKLVIGVLIILPHYSCTKNWLDAKPNAALVVPSSANDYQNLLDNQALFNYNEGPALGEISTNDYYLSTLLKT